jgi:hypothetical protein
MIILSDADSAYVTVISSLWNQVNALKTSFLYLLFIVFR